MENVTTRMVWVDYMKVIGIFGIVAGHFFPIGFEYIYIFSVPVFFIISGFLFKKDSSTKKFFKKLLHSLVIPMLILALIGILWNCLLELNNGSLNSSQLIYRLSGDLIDMCIGGGSLGVCWFIYTLIILKILFQFSGDNFKSIIAIMAVGICYLLKDNHLALLNAFPNACVALPLFYIGYLLQNSKHILDNLKPSSPLYLALFLCSIPVVYYMEDINGAPWMYNNGFGESYLWFLFGGFAGTFMIYYISKVLSIRDFKFIKTISIGNIIILGLHPIAISLVRGIFPRISEYKQGTLLDYAISAIIVIAFYWIILLCQRFFPAIIGRRKLS